MRVSESERQEAIKRLKEIIKPGDTLTTVLRHVSRSGMSRDIDVFKLGNGSRSWLSWLTARACGFTFNENRECVKVGGAGMDMGFHIVYTLSSVLFRDGFDCIGENCPANDHFNDRNCDRVAGKHHHKDGGYALKQDWL